MKRFKLSHIFMLLMLALAIVAGCTKEGPAGLAGTNGTDGTDGVDGNASCIQCHTLAKKEAVTAKYEMSTHFNSNMMYNGQTVYQFASEGPSHRDCAGCHSEQGFVEWQYTGELIYADTTGLQNAWPVSCVACHDMHSTLDFENDGIDYALRTTDPVELIMYSQMEPSQSVVLDMGRNSNLCVNCHQPRMAGPDITSAADSFYIPGIYWGPHHGPHSTTLEGIGAFEVGEDYPEAGSSAHRTVSSCISCHMHNATAITDEQVGGHTWHTPISACTGCHEDATDFNYNNIQNDVADLMAQLKQKFIDNGMWNTSTDNIIEGTYTLNQAGAYYNYLWISDDRSGGIHNPAYIKTLLINSIAVFN